MVLNKLNVIKKTKVDIILFHNKQTFHKHEIVVCYEILPTFVS